MSAVESNRDWRLEKLGEKAGTFSPNEIVNDGAIRVSKGPDTAVPTGANRTTVYVAVEISLKSWIAGVHCPDASGGSVSIHTLAAADTAELLDLVGSVRERVTGGRAPVRA